MMLAVNEVVMKAAIMALRQCFQNQKNSAVIAESPEVPEGLSLFIGGQPKDVVTTIEVPNDLKDQVGDRQVFIALTAANQS